jgi:para-nitrobenzyl esterase
MKSWSFARGAIAASLLMCCAVVFATPGPVVKTGAGPITGELRGALRIFRGIPFAAPPVDRLRWELPQPAQPWTDVRDATKFGAPCPIPAGLGQGSKGEPGSVHGPGYDIWIAKMEPGSSEDCLTLNVWAPDATIEKAPVMVFLSPSGSTTIPFFDGSAFARDGVVFVSPNNRMFTQSMFAHPALTAAAMPAKPAGRLQEWDRIAALEWIRNNIAAFGGDPQNVTLFGESNSAASILALMTAPRSKGLFHKAIIQSGTSRGPWFSRDATERIGVELARMAGLDGEKATIEQLLALPIDRLPFFAALTADARLLPQSVQQAFERGQTHDVALLVGGNTWDGSSLRYPPARIIERSSAEVLKAYASDELSGDALGYAIYTDEHVNAPARWYAAAHARKGSPVYHYIYSYVSSFRKQPLGAAHGEVLPFVFDSWDQIPALSKVINDDDRRVTKMMHACWIAFARTGKPGCDGVPEWPTYTEATGWTMELGKSSKLHQHYRNTQYAAHDREHARTQTTERDAREVLDALREAQPEGR